jgi:hypothetical protein
MGSSYSAGLLVLVIIRRMFILEFVPTKSIEADRSPETCVQMPSVNCNVFHRNRLTDKQELANEGAMDSAVNQLINRLDESFPEFNRSKLE